MAYVVQPLGKNKKMLKGLIGVADGLYLAERGNHMNPIVSLGQGDYARDIKAEDILGSKKDCAERYPFLIREPEEVYHAMRGSHLTAHALAEFRHCPAQYRAYEVGLEPRPVSAAYLIGRAIHTLWLEGREAYQAAYQIGGEPRNKQTGKVMSPTSRVYKQWVESLDKPLIRESQSYTIEMVYASLCVHPVTRELFRDGVAEGVVRTDMFGHACQSRIDFIGRYDGLDIVVDLKTADSLDGFESAAIEFEYIHQLAFYRKMIINADGPDSAYYIVAVEKKFPYRVGVWNVPHYTLDMAEWDNTLALKELHECRESGVWPTRYEQPGVLKFPES